MMRLSESVTVTRRYGFVYSKCKRKGSPFFSSTSEFRIFFVAIRKHLLLLYTINHHGSQQTGDIDILQSHAYY